MVTDGEIEAIPRNAAGSDASSGGRVAVDLNLDHHGFSMVTRSAHLERQPRERNPGLMDIGIRTRPDPWRKAVAVQICLKFRRGLHKPAFF